ncbi:MAG: TolC family protein [Myxococcales bacterium]|nr:TolC family protein [Myxococcota bacterium]MDW8284190.1 TolC family protein [Myxococcales bacterium]
MRHVYMLRAGRVARALCGLVVLAGVLAPCPPAWAEGAFSLASLLRELELRSPVLRARRAAIQAAAERPVQARALEDPMLMAELWQVPLHPHEVPLMFTLRQPLAWPGKLRARAEALEPEVAEARAALASAVRLLRLEAAYAYHDYRLAVRALAVQREHRLVLQTVVDAVEVRYRVGRAELAALLQARQALAELDSALLDLERQRDAAQTTINTLLDRPADHPLGEPTSVPVPRPLPALATLTELALAHRPELAMIEAALARARGKQRAAGAERAPDLAVWTAYMAMPRAGEHRLTVGVQTSLPSFSLSRSNAAMREAAADVAMQEALLAQARARVRGEVRQAVLGLQTARRHIDLHRNTLIPLAEQALQAAQASYGTGRTDMVLLLAAARTLIGHRLDHERFVAEYGQRLAELEAAIGTSLPAAEASQVQP